MNELVQISLNKELRSNPKEIASMIIQLSKDIHECRDNLEEIKNRNWWKKIFSNNIRYLADALIKQNDTQSTFVNIVQVLIYINLHNGVFLGDLYKEMTKHSYEMELTENEYFILAKDYISEALEAAQKTKNRFTEIEYLIKSVMQKQNNLQIIFIIFAIIILIIVIIYLFR